MNRKPTNLREHVSLKGKDACSRFIMAHGFSPLYSGRTYFSGVPELNKLPQDVVSGLLLGAFGWLRWAVVESSVGVFKSKH